MLTQGVEDLAKRQELLWASDSYSLLVVFQALDAAGKDSAIEHVMSGVNPQGVQVVSFKQPSDEELDHDFLWRTARALPERGRIGIFNRSHYEEVVALRVHPEWLDAQRLPPGDRGTQFWADRYEDINVFEKHLHRNGTRIVKFFLHLSKAEQKRRFIARLDNPDKHWKFNADDVAERQHWDEYMTAFEQAITATSTPWAPWYVVPADNKRITRAVVAANSRHDHRRARSALPRGQRRAATRERGGPAGTRGRSRLTERVRDYALTQRARPPPEPAGSESRARGDAGRT